jgi:peptide deformylase
MIRNILQLGNPLLRQKSKPVLAARGIESLAKDLLDTLQAAGGVGLAASQIGEMLRAALVASQPNDRYPLAPRMEPLLIINPEIIWASPEMEKEWEGCLSIPGIRGLVPRSTVIRVRFLEPATGQDVIQEYAGFVARVFQHELDHLGGKVFLDRVESTLELASEQEYQRILAERLKN